MNISATLKHLNIDIASLELADYNGSILRYKCLVPERQPYLREMTLKEINEWWQNRAIPNKRSDINSILSESECSTAMLYTLKNLALSLFDCYWVCPNDIELNWENVNLYENTKHNTFIDENGIEYYNNPNNSLNGNLNKEAIFIDNKWQLIKYSETLTGEQNVNEAFAGFLHEKQGFDDYVKYNINMDEGKPISCSCDFFTSKTVEFVSAYNFTAYKKQNNDLSNYEQYILYCSEFDLDRNKIRDFMDYQTLTDFAITNTDRHYSNFGLLRDPDTLRFISPAPIFDSGNSMFYKELHNMSAYDILNLPISAMAKHEELMLEYVSNREIIDLSKMPTREETIDYYINNGILEDRATIIGNNYDMKLKMLAKYQEGRKVSRYYVKDWDAFINPQS